MGIRTHMLWDSKYSNGRIDRKTGQPAHFKVWKHEAAARAILLRARTEAIASLPSLSSNHGIRIGILRIAEKFPTLWDLSNANRGELLGITGVGDGTLRKLQKYLEGKNVAVKWAGR